MNLEPWTLDIVFHSTKKYYGSLWVHQVSGYQHLQNIYFFVVCICVFVCSCKLLIVLCHCQGFKSSKRGFKWRGDFFLWKVCSKRQNAAENANLMLSIDQSVICHSTYGIAIWYYFYFTFFIYLAYWCQSGLCYKNSIVVKYIKLLE